MKSITCDFCQEECRDTAGWVLTSKDFCPECASILRQALGMATGVSTSYQGAPQRPVAERNPLLETDFGQGVQEVNGSGIGRNFVGELEDLRIRNAEKRRRV